MLVERTRARYAAVHTLTAQGKTITAIVAELQLSRGTVRRFVRAANVEELIAAPRAGRPSVLDRDKPYLHERWNAAITNAGALYREITAQGYRGRQVTVAAYLRRFRTPATAPPVAAIVPKARHVASWMLRHPDDLDDEQLLHLKQARASCPGLDATAAHVSAFAAMLTGRHGERLESWMAAVEADNLPHLKRFVTGLRRDHAAVLNGLSLAHSSGAVEGNVNRIKMIKRQMYGRATFDLLRKRILLTR